ncbi:hypothetical protein ACE1QC_003822 [Morganella morganii]
MAAENRTKFIVDLVGNVTQRARQFGASFRSLGAEGSRSMRLFSGAVTGANSILDKFDNKLVGFVTGGGLAMATKRVAEHQQAMVELGTQYNLTADQVNALDEQIAKVAGRRKLSSSDLTQAANAFLLQTNNFDATLEQLDNMALLIKGIGVESQSSGEKLGAMFNSGYNSPEKIRKWLDGIASATQFGTGDIKTQFDALPSMGKNTPWKNQSDQMQMLALMRIANQEFDDPSQASSAVQGFFDSVSTKEGRQKLKVKGGINTKGKNGELKSPADLLAEIVKAGYGKEDNLKDVFSGDTLKLAMIFADSKKQAQLRDAANPANIRDGFLDEKATQNVQTFNGAMTSLVNAGERFAQLKLAKPVQDLADAINDLTPEELDKYAATIEKAAYAIGAAVAARYAWRAGKSIYNFAKGGGGGAGGPGAGGLGDGGVTSVYVTNWPANFGGRGSSGGGGGMGGAGKAMNMLTNTAVVGWITGEVTPYVESALDWGFEGNERYRKMRDAKTFGELYDVSIGDVVDTAAGNISTENGTKPSPYSTGFPRNPNFSPEWPKAPPLSAGDNKPAEPVKPPDGQIRVIVEAAADLVVKTKSVESENVDLRVSTGYSGGSKM